MLVKRDLFYWIQQRVSLEAVVLWGPRQVGKTTLLDRLPLNSRIFLDDLPLRAQCQQDPAFVLNNHPPPLLIDEIQYAPELVSEIKLRIDAERRLALKNNAQKKSGQFFLTGSNKKMIDDRIKESLAGRAHLLTLHGLSLHEINALPPLSLRDIVFKGGFPELYTRDGLSEREYLNSYIVSFLEKDIAQSAGIQKLGEFQTVLRLLAARSGQFINFSEISQAAGVDVKTVEAWTHLLQRNLILDLVPTFASNLSKRIVKMKKLFFYDTGLCARLQGHVSAETMLHSPHMGALFETLVFSELAKTRDHFQQDWHLHTWRTKEQQERDFIVETSPDVFFFIEAKLGTHGSFGYELDSEAKKVFAKKAFKKIVVIAAGTRTRLPHDTEQVPAAQLAEFLLSASHDAATTLR